MTGAVLAFAIVRSLAEIFALLAVGGVCRHLRYIDDREIDRWSKLILDFLYPAFVFSSITQGFHGGMRPDLWILPLIGFAIAAGGAVLGLGLRFGLRTSNSDMVRTFLYFCTVNNYVFLPVVIVRNIWGPSMLANLFCLTFGSTLANWTIGIGVLGSTSPRQILRNLATPTLFATIAAIIIAWLGWSAHIPAIVNHIVVSAGSVSVPMMLVLSGASLFTRSSLTITWQVVWATMVRLLILPACAIIILRLFPLSMEVYSIAVIVALMPLAISSVIYIRVFGGDVDFAARASFFSTLAAIITVPLALWLLFR